MTKSLEHKLLSQPPPTRTRYLDFALPDENIEAFVQSGDYTETPHMLRRKVGDKARIVTRPPRFEPRFSLIEEKNMLLVRGRKMLSGLGDEKNSLRAEAIAKTPYASLTEEFLTDIDIAIESNNEAKLKELGLTFDFGWVEAIVESMIKNKPLELQVMTDTIKSMVDGFRRDVLDYGALGYHQAYALRFAAVVKKTMPKHHSFIRAVVDDYRVDGIGEFTTQTQRDRCAVHIEKVLIDSRVISVDNKPGEDYAVLRTSDHLPKAEELLTLLSDAKNGTVVSQNEKLHFFPNNWLIDALGSLSDTERNNLQEKGILLAEENVPTPTLLKAASSLSSERKKNNDIIRILLLNEAIESPQTDIYTLLRAANLVTRDTYQTMRFNRPHLHLGVESITYGLVKVLEWKLKKLVSHLETDTDFSQMDENFGYTYIDENYGSGVEGKGFPWDILPTDISLIDALLENMKDIVPEGGFEKSINIGRGSFSYIDQLFSPYVKHMELAEPFEPMRKVADQWIDGTLPPEYDNVARKFERFFIKHPKGGGRYIASEYRTKRKAEVTDRKMEDLPDATYDLIMESFTSCSTARSKVDFWEKIRQKRKGLKESEKSKMVALHMVGSRGWDGFPAVNLSLHDIKQAYLDADMEITHFVPVMNDETGGKTREGYDGMVLVVAKPRSRKSLVAT